MAKMNPVVHFEMSFEDRERMTKFYEMAFGWQTQVMGPDLGNYVVVQTTETDDKGMIKKPGNINGGFYPAAPGHKGVSVVISVDDIFEAMKKVKESGGTVTGGSQGPDKPDNIPGV